MKKIRNMRDLNYQLEIVQIQRQVELKKLKRNIHKTRKNIFPSIVSFALGAIFKKKKKR